MLEGILRDFLREGSDKRRKDHLVNWDVVSLPNSEEGLGMGHIIEKNIALHGKWLWRIPQESNSLWHTTTKSKYGLQDNRWDSCVVEEGTY